MRIIGGKHRRRVIESPQGEHTRPTTERTREAIFNILPNLVNLEGATVLDLFAGSAALGLEALSRGGSRAVFVDSDYLAIKIMKANAASLDELRQCEFIRQDVFSWLKHQSAPDYSLILADPPYQMEDLGELVRASLTLLNSEGVLVLEHDRRNEIQDHQNASMTRKYGKSRITVFSNVR